LIKACNKGFTLLEILVAVAIIAIAFTGILKLYSQSVAMAIRSNFYAKAPLLAEKIIAEWEAGMMAQGTPFTIESPLEEFKGYDFEIQEQALDPGELLSENAKDGQAELVELTCTVSYNNGEFTYKTKTLKLISQ
jgi:general secretion pathway protein I